MVKLEIRNPVAHAKLGANVLAPRLSGVDNKNIGLWWNGKGGGDVAVTRIGELLGQKYKNVKLELIRASTTGGKSQIAHAQKFDAVVGATAD